MSSGSHSQISDAHSGVYSSTCFRKSSPWAVRAPTNSSFTSPSRAMTCAIASSRDTSEPTRMGRCTSAISASPIRRGSATIIFAPRASACLRRVAATGWHSVMLVPMQKITSGLSMSARGFDIAPLPIVAARPATVGACQARLQLSMWFVPNPALMKRCIM